MRDDVKIGILLGFLFGVGMFIWWLVHSQAGKPNAPVALTGENPAHVDRTGLGSSADTRTAAPTPAPAAGTGTLSLSNPVPPIIPVVDPPPALTEPPPLTPVPGPGNVVMAPGGGATTPPPAGGPVPGTTDAFNKLEVTSDGTRLYTTQADDVAWNLGIKFYGNGSKWTLIKDANPTMDIEHNLRAGIKIKIPVPPPPAVVTAGTPTVHPGPTSAPNEYVVQTGDTLSKIAREKLGSESLWRKILELNPGLSETSLPVGKAIKLPPKPDAHPTAGPTHPATPATPAAPLGPNEYQVQTDDTLSKIAREKLGKESLWDKIVELNPGLNPDSLQVGKVIKLPPKPAAPAPTPAPASGIPDAPHTRL